MPLKLGLYNNFQKRYIKIFGKPPNRLAIRAYDLIVDLISRLAYIGNLREIDKVGEIDYEENRFLYQKQNNSFLNTGFFLLQHRNIDVIELKK